MARGAPPKPKRLKLAPGRPSARPAGTVAPSPSPDLPEPAEWLPEGAIPQFHELVTKLQHMGYASQSHAEALNLLAFQLHRVAETARTLESMKAGSMESVRVSNALNIAARSAQSLAIEFGLTPASSTRIAVPDRREGNPFAVFRQDDGR